MSSTKESQIKHLLISAEKLLYLNKYDQAEKLLDKVMKLDEINAECHYFLGEVYCKQRKFNDSIIMLKKADRLFPNNARIIHLLGWATFMSGDVKLGGRLILQALASLPKDVQILCDLAVIENQQGNIDEARKYVLMALEIDPKNSLAQEVFQTVEAFRKLRSEARTRNN